MTTVLVAVVLALTGFQTGKSGSGKSSGDGGGGCSSSGKGNGGYRSHGDGGGSSGGSGDSGGSGGSGSSYTAEPSATASDSEVTAVVTECVDEQRRGRKTGPGKKKGSSGATGDTAAATVKVTSHADRRRTYRVVLDFSDARGRYLSSGTGVVAVDPDETVSIEVRMDFPADADRVGKCEIDGVEAIGS